MTKYFLAATATAITLFQAVPAMAQNDVWDLSFSDFGYFNNEGTWVGGNSARSGANVALTSGTQQLVRTQEIYFYNVAPGSTGDSSSILNVKVTATVFLDSNVKMPSGQSGEPTPQAGNPFTFTGFVPDYYSGDNSPSVPQEDFGLHYQFLGTTNRQVAVGGVRFSFSFFTGTVAQIANPSLRSEDDFNLDINSAFIVPALRFMAYDVDGDSGNRTGEYQRESVRAYLDEGLYGYHVSKDDPITVTSETYQGRESYVFTGGLVNIDEKDPRVTSILVYENTSGFTLDFFSESRSQNNTGSYDNPVFSALDGDLSLLKSRDPNKPVEEIMGELFGRMEVVKTVPEPSTVFLLGAAGVGIAARLLRRRKA